MLILALECSNTLHGNYNGSSTTSMYLMLNDWYASVNPHTHTQTNITHTHTHTHMHTFKRRHTNMFHFYADSPTWHTSARSSTTTTSTSTFTISTTFALLYHVLLNHINHFIWDAEIFYCTATDVTLRHAPEAITVL